MTTASRENTGRLAATVSSRRHGGIDRPDATSRPRFCISPVSFIGLAVLTERIEQEAPEEAERAWSRSAKKNKNKKK